MLTSSKLGETALFAGFGTITIFWNYVRNIFARISSFVVISADLSPECGGILVGYCREKMGNIRLNGERNIWCEDKFVRPLSRWHKVAVEGTGRNMTFWDGWKPLFVGMTMADKGSGMGNSHVKLSFIRGTFDLEKLIFDAMENFNKEKEKANKHNKRYQVNRAFGSMRDDSIAKSPEGSVSGSSNPDMCNLIGWKKEDVGPAVVEEPFERLAYADSIEELKTELRHWKDSESWYKKKGIDWRFGAGLFGPPGTGKTSFVRAVGQELDLPIMICDLSSMSNMELTGFWQKSLSCAPCIVLFEDLDRVFDKDKNIKGSKMKSGVTMDCLLNCMQGVESANGVLIFVTANDHTKLDPALGIPDSITGKSTRPGRLDRSVYFGLPDEKARVHIANRILSEVPHLIETTVREGDGETGAQFENRCAQLALREYWGGFKVIIRKETLSENQQTLS